MTADVRAVVAHLRHRAIYWDWPSASAALCREAANVIDRQADAIDRARDVLDSIAVDADGRVRAHDLTGLAVLLEGEE